MGARRRTGWGRLRGLDASDRRVPRRRAVDAPGWPILTFRWSGRDRARQEPAEGPPQDVRGASHLRRACHFQHTPPQNVVIHRASPSRQLQTCANLPPRIGRRASCGSSGGLSQGFKGVLMSVGSQDLASDAGEAPASLPDRSDVAVFLSPQVRAAVEPLREHVRALFQEADDALADLQQQLMAARQRGKAAS
jgi:hypothetical protein